MYRFKKESLGNLKIDKTDLSKAIGISRQSASNIITNRTNCRKTTAYCITKYINENAEINDYFERV